MPHVALSSPLTIDRSIRQGIESAAHQHAANHHSASKQRRGVVGGACALKLIKAASPRAVGNGSGGRTCRELPIEVRVRPSPSLLQDGDNRGTLSALLSVEGKIHCLTLGLH